MLSFENNLFVRAIVNKRETLKAIKTKDTSVLKQRGLNFLQPSDITNESEKKSTGQIYKCKVNQIDNYLKYTSFVTDGGIEYIIAFERDDNKDGEYFKDNPEIQDKIYHFMFFPNVDIDALPRQDKLNIARDPKIRNTVTNVLGKFLKAYGKENVIFYYCENQDGKEKGRSKLFNSWFHHHQAKDSIIKLEDSVVGGAGKNKYAWYNAMLIHKDNPMKDKFINVYKNLNHTIKNYREQIREQTKVVDISNNLATLNL